MLNQILNARLSVQGRSYGLELELKLDGQRLHDSRSLSARGVPRPARPGPHTLRIQFEVFQS
eukprot:3166072-Pyramimonas_sp.AAC.1